MGLYQWVKDKVSNLGVFELDVLTEKEQIKSRKKINKATDIFYNELIKYKIVSPSVYDLISFNIWKRNTEVFNIYADKDYWNKNDLLKKDYYYNVKINFIKKYIANIITYFINKKMDNVFKH